jgi:sarcosine oxidase, subunit alpha
MRGVEVGGYRLARGGLIDRSRAVSFTFNGRELRGYQGDTLASALIANGVTLIGRSFKYHRPRGFYGAGLEDPNSMLAVRDAYGYEPALRAGQVQLCEGLEARSVTGYPSPDFDLAAGVQLFARILGAGFYYKTFKWPDWAWFEPWIERSTGFGRPRADIVEQRSVHHRHVSCDVLIIGAGPAGLAAARALAPLGLRVLLADDRPQVGGALNFEQGRVQGRPCALWASVVGAQLAAERNITMLTSTVVTAAYEGNHFTLVQCVRDSRGVRAEHCWKVSARQVVLASGMIDRPLLFPNNDRPGIMLSGAVRRLIGEFGVSPARRLAVFTNNDCGYLTALAAREAGVEVAAIVDTRPPELTLHAGSARDAGIECLFSSQITATAGYRRLNRITVRDANRRVRHICCDGLAVTGGFTPLIHLASHRGVKPTFDAKLGGFLASGLPAGWHVAGGVNGTVDLESSLSDGGRAAQAVSAAAGIAAAPVPTEAVDAGPLGMAVSQWQVEPGTSSQVWVDFQNDVKVSDVELAARENYVSVEHLKRYTTLGMGTDQGRTSNVNGLALLASLTGREIGAVGTTTFRPPYTAVRMGTIANGRQGSLYKPRRYLPAHAVHENLSAVFEDFGWERPDWYRCNGAHREAAVAVEMEAVRKHVGVFDGSSLGKIEVTGPDAGEFLSRFYVSSMASLKPGRIRYSVMLKEDGVIFDDGVVACLAENHYLASPTSGHAEAVAGWFERWRQTEWPSMRVAVSPVTSNWASIAIAGPRAREVLERLAPGFDISNAAFPHMRICGCEIGGVEARVARVSFTGELQYEISVPARYGAALWQVLLAPDGQLAPVPIGMEAWLRLRLEKGYLHVGSDTNGRTTPLDVGMAGAVAKREDDFIGKRSLSLAFMKSVEREQLVGLVGLDGALEVGGRVLAPGAVGPPCATEGYVTSACFSPSVGQSIGLALVERGFAREGETVAVYSSGKIVRGRISRPVFYDPRNERLGV